MSEMMQRPPLAARPHKKRSVRREPRAAISPKLAALSIPDSERSSLRGFGPRANVSLKQLWAFLSVAETGSFTASAADLCTTQSAVSTLIKELELEIDFRLFDRTTRTVQLTDEGRELRDPANRVLFEFQSAITKAKRLAAQKRGSVTVVASPLMSSLMLPATLGEFRAAYPKINIVLRDAPFDQIRRLVLAGEADIGLGLMPEEGESLIGEVLVADELVVLFLEGHPLEALRTVTWREVAKYPFIALTPENGTRQLADKCAADFGVTITPSCEVSFIWTAIGLVSAGLGITVVPCYVRTLGPSQSMKMRKIQSKKTKANIALLRRRDVALSPAAELFRRFIRNSLK